MYDVCMFDVWLMCDICLVMIYVWWYVFDCLMMYVGCVDDVWCMSGVCLVCVVRGYGL